MSQVEPNPSTAPAARTRTGLFHMIGNAHIDPVWLWNWQEGFQEVKSTFRSALDRLAEFPDFVFTCSSAGHYAWVERNEPEMFEEIRARVAEGRWVLVGGWWVQPDCNLPGGESFARQGLYGQRFFHSRFGRTATVGYNPDSFGHAGTLPQLLRGAGLTAYTFMRPGPHEQGLPSRLFHWQGPDGSRVLAFRIPYEYCTWGKDLEAHIRKCTTEIGALDELMCFYGVGNHGGGPTKENLASIARLSHDETLPELRLSSPDAYFASVADRPDIPVWSDELQHHAVGCYAAHSGIKAWMRGAENALMSAEKFSAVAEVVAGQPYPHAELTHAWQQLLFNQFHDILAGASIESAYRDARDALGEVRAIADRARNDAVQRLSWRVNIPHEDGARPVVVFNPHPFPVTSTIDLEVGGLKDDAGARDDTGKHTFMQFVRSEATVSGWRRRVAFRVDLPPLGYRTYTLRPNDAPADMTPVPAQDGVLENEHLRVTIDPATGGIASLLDKRFGREVFRASAAVGVVMEDRSDTWSHGVFRYDQEVGRFESATVKLLEQGPLRSAYRTTARYGNSTLTQDFLLSADSPVVEVRVRVDWHERQKALKLAFPANLHFPEAMYEVPYGVIQRPTDGSEEPGQSWVDLHGVVRESGLIGGVALVNDAKSSYSIRQSTLELTVLRSPISAHHDPYVPTEDGDYRFMDQGEQTFRYLIVPHGGTWRDADLSRLALVLNQPPVGVVETYHAGPLPQSASFVSVDARNVDVTVVKRAEDGGAIVIRAVETLGRGVDATLSLPLLEREIPLAFRPYEIKTVFVPLGPDLPHRETNLTELE